MTVSAFFLAILRTQIDESFFLFNEFQNMLIWSVYINIILAVFNLIPFPPLDGSRMVSSFLVMKGRENMSASKLLFFIFYFVMDNKYFFLRSNPGTKGRVGLSRTFYIYVILSKSGTL